MEEVAKAGGNYFLNICASVRELTFFIALLPLAVLHVSMMVILFLVKALLALVTALLSSLVVPQVACKHLKSLNTNFCILLTKGVMRSVE